MFECASWLWLLCVQVRARPDETKKDAQQGPHLRVHRVPLHRHSSLLERGLLTGHLLTRFPPGMSQS